MLNRESGRLRTILRTRQEDERELVGFSDNKKDLEFDLPKQISDKLEFRVEINEIFRNPYPVDFTVLSRVIFNKEDASNISANYQTGFIHLQ